jgi:hypothetical protein
VQQIDPAHVEKAYALIERGPVTFVAAFFVVAFAVMLTLYVLKTKEMAAREREYAAQMEKFWADDRAQAEAERKRSVRLEMVASRLVEVADLVRYGRGRGRPRTDPGLMSTVKVELPPEGSTNGDNDE